MRGFTRRKIFILQWKDPFVAAQIHKVRWLSINQQLQNGAYNTTI